MRVPDGFKDSDFPWHRVNAVDRGFEEECWWWDGSFSGYFLRASRKLWMQVFDDHPRKSEGRCFNHTCEAWGERNLCIRPDHVFIGTWSTNARTLHANKRAAGVPHWSPEGRARVVDALSAPKTPETCAKMSAAAKQRYADRKDERYDCPVCGKSYSWLWINRHMRDIHP